MSNAGTKKGVLERLGPRERSLITLLAILLVALVWRLVAGVGGGSALLGGAATPARESSSLDQLRVIEPRLAALTAERAQYEPGRNIFRFGERPKPPPPPPPPAPPPPPVRDVKPPPPPPPAGPQPPPLDLELLGIFGPDSRRIAVLRDGELLINALTGDVIDDKFVVREIDYESVLFAFVGFPGVEPERLLIGQ